MDHTTPKRPGLWLRHEVAATEQRTPITPADAADLVAAGLPVTVEESARRAFPISEYAAAGCRVAPAGSWPDAPLDYVIAGLKEPSPHPVALRHTHIFFGHAYKGQSGAIRLLRRFITGGGLLLDLETVTDETGRRLATFGFPAGYAGAALAVLHRRGDLRAPLTSTSRSALDLRLRASSGGARALVVGALGRSGRGACEALATAGVPVTRWDIDETRKLDRAALLDHDILVNCVHTTEPGEPFLRDADFDHRHRRLAVVSDVTCDVTSACNRLPVNDKVTAWERPSRRLHAGPPPLDVLAIDNLPSLIPRETSTTFSADLLPALRTLHEGGPIWARCLERFHRACQALARSDQ